MLRLVIADDHAPFRTALKGLLSGLPGISVIGEAGGAAEIVAACRDLAPDVLLLDISMPGAADMSTVATVSREFPGIRTVVLSMHDDPAVAKRAMLAGARGYLARNAGVASLQSALRIVGNGGWCMQPVQPSIAGRTPEKLAMVPEVVA